MKEGYLIRDQETLRCVCFGNIIIMKCEIIMAQSRRLCAAGRNNIYIATLCILLISCNKKQDINFKDNYSTIIKDSISFYDFDFLIQIEDERIGTIESFKYMGNADETLDSCIVIHEILSSNNKIDYDSLKISKAKMDLTYALIAEELTPQKNNKSILKIPTPKTYENEWTFCTIKLNLKHRGEKYSTSLKNYHLFLKKLDL